MGLIIVLLGFLLLAFGAGSFLLGLLAVFEGAGAGSYFLVAIAFLLGGGFLVAVGSDADGGGGGGDFKANPFLEPDSLEDGASEDDPTGGGAEAVSVGRDGVGDVEAER